MVYLILALILSMSPVYAWPHEENPHCNLSARENRRIELLRVRGALDCFFIDGTTSRDRNNVHVLAYQYYSSSFDALIETKMGRYFLYHQSTHHRCLQKIDEDIAKNWVRSNAVDYYEDICWGGNHD